MVREIVVFFDIDNTQNHFAPPPLKTMFSLLKGGLTIPEPGQQLGPAKSSGIANSVFHWIRPFTEDSRLGLAMLRQEAFESGRNIRLAVLSGRDPGLHEMTMRKLRNSGRIEYFDKGEIYLSTVSSSSGYKELKGADEVQKGNSVVLFEDDLAAALRFSRLQEKCQEGQAVWVYLLKNISNHPWLLRRAHVDLPDNVERISSFQAGAKSLVARIYGGLI